MRESFKNIKRKKTQEEKTKWMSILRKKNEKEEKHEGTIYI